MISTLFAQEFRTTRKRLLSVVGILLLVAVTAFIVAALRVPFLGGMALGAGLIATVAITPTVLIILAATYWRTMYGAEGYFTMAIPARGRTLFAAKVLYGLAASYVALLLTAAGLVLAAVAFALMKGQGALDFLREGLETLDPTLGWFMVIAFVLQLTFAVITGAALMSIGAEARFNHLGFGAPVIFGVVLYFVMQIVGFAATLFIPFSVRLTGPDAGTFSTQPMLGDFLAAMKEPSAPQDPSVIGVGMILVSVIAMVVFAWWGARSVDRRTSLR